MRRRISLLLAAVLAGSTLMLFGPTQPASAVVDCVGVLGQVHVTPGLLFPVLLGVLGRPAKDHDVDLLIGKPNTVHGFVFVFTAGACIHVRVPPTVSGVTGAGTLKGYCGHSSGVGTVNGESFAFVTSGGVVAVTGHVVGTAIVVPTPLTGSCLHIEGPPTVNPSNPYRLATGGATQFTLVAAAGVGLNCPNSLAASETLFRPIQQTLVLQQPVGVHVDLGVHIYTMSTCTNPSVLL